MKQILNAMYQLFITLFCSWVQDRKYVMILFLFSHLIKKKKKSICFDFGYMKFSDDFGYVKFSDFGVLVRWAL